MGECFEFTGALPVALTMCCVPPPRPVCELLLQPEDPSVKRASKHSPTALLGPTGLLSPVGQLPPTGLNPSPLSPAGNPFLAAAAAAAAAAGSPTAAMHLPGMLGPMALRPATFSPVTNLRDNPPCNTLFIGNLGDNTNEQELRVLMGSQPGYRSAHASSSLDSKLHCMFACVPDCCCSGTCRALRGSSTCQLNNAGIGTQAAV